VCVDLTWTNARFDGGWVSAGSGPHPVRKFDEVVPAVLVLLRLVGRLPAAAHAGGGARRPVLGDRNGAFHFREFCGRLFPAVFPYFPFVPLLVLRRSRSAPTPKPLKVMQYLQASARTRVRAENRSADSFRELLRDLF
jgi:hypothetical protein